MMIQMLILQPLQANPNPNNEEEEEEQRKPNHKIQSHRRNHKIGLLRITKRNVTAVLTRSSA
jgi:hypothetical protein